MFKSKACKSFRVLWGYMFDPKEIHQHIMRPNTVHLCAVAWLHMGNGLYHHNCKSQNPNAERRTCERKSAWAAIIFSIILSIQCQIKCIKNKCKVHIHIVGFETNFAKDIVFSKIHDKQMLKIGV